MPRNATERTISLECFFEANLMEKKSLFPLIWSFMRAVCATSVDRRLMLAEAERENRGWLPMRKVVRWRIGDNKDTSGGPYYITLISSMSY